MKAKPYLRAFTPPLHDPPAWKPTSPRPSPPAAGGEGEGIFRVCSQGSSCLATLGWMPQPRWGSEVQGFNAEYFREFSPRPSLPREEREKIFWARVPRAGLSRRASSLRSFCPGLLSCCPFGAQERSSAALEDFGASIATIAPVWAGGTHGPTLAGTWKQSSAALEHIVGLVARDS
jgi:hypothetical protein